MESVTVSKPFASDLQDMVERCRTLDSRRFWPGAQLMGGNAGVLYYMTSMRLKAATMTDIDIEERLTQVEDADGGAKVFRSTQKVSWPDGVAEGETEYVFTPGSPNTLTFTYRYAPPSTKLVKSKALPAFHDGMQKVAQRYVDGLTGSAVSA